MTTRFAMFLGTLIGTNSMFGPPSAFGATDFPTYNILNFCVGRIAPSGVNDCVTLQTAAQRKASSLWLLSTEDEKINCLNYVEDDEVPPSYMRLRDCLDLEIKRR